MRDGIALQAIFGAVLLAAGATGIGAQTPALSCHGAQRPKMVAELLFGRDIGKRAGVSQSAWAAFVASEMTPRFPDGMIPKSGSRFSEKIMRPIKNLDHDPIQSNWIMV